MASGRTAMSSAVAGIERACARAETPDELFEILDHEVRAALPLDASMWFAVDPATLLASAPARIEGVDGGYCETFWHHEFHDNDVVLFRDLCRADTPAASLREATHNRPVRSARYREFLAPQGYEDELRAVFRAGGSTWAMASVCRTSSTKPFIVFAEMLASGMASDSIWSIVSILLPTRATVEKTTRPLASVA